MSQDERYYHTDGSLKWGHPENVAHLILQLQALDPEMKVSAVTFLDMPEGRRARAYGLSLSRERWDEGGWLNFRLPGPKCLAFWATEPPIEEVHGVRAFDAARAVVYERKRQVESEGFTAEKDNQHVDGQLAVAAAAYSAAAWGQSYFGSSSYSDNSVVVMARSCFSCVWKPSRSRIRNLIKAGALILAEIDRLRRAGVVCDGE